MMKTMFSAAMLSTLLVVSACGKKDEPAAEAGSATSENAAPTSAPAADATDTSAGDTAEVEVAGDLDGADGATTETAVPAAADAGTPAASTATTTTTTTTSSTVSSVATPPANAPASASALATAPAAKPAAKPAAATTTVTTTTTTTSSTVTLNGDPGSMVRAETLRARPAADAPEAGQLAAAAKVKVLARDGGWYQVNGDGKTGWVRMLSVRRSEAPSTSIAGIAGITSGRTGTGKVVTTTGVRGLDSGDLSAAVFDEARIAKAETLRVSRADAEAFARQGGLTTQAVAALPAPAK